MSVIRLNDQNLSSEQQNHAFQLMKAYAELGLEYIPDPILPTTISEVVSYFDANQNGYLDDLDLVAKKQNLFSELLDFVKQIDASLIEGATSAGDSLGYDDGLMLLSVFALGIVSWDKLEAEIRSKIAVHQTLDQAKTISFGQSSFKIPQNTTVSAEILPNGVVKMTVRPQSGLPVELQCPYGTIVITKPFTLFGRSSTSLPQAEISSAVFYPASKYQNQFIVENLKIGSTFSYSTTQAVTYLRPNGSDMQMSRGHSYNDGAIMYEEGVRPISHEYFYSERLDRLFSVEWDQNNVGTVLGGLNDKVSQIHLNGLAYNEISFTGMWFVERNKVSKLIDHAFALNDNSYVEINGQRYSYFVNTELAPNTMAENILINRDRSRLHIDGAEFVYNSQSGLYENIKSRIGFEYCHPDQISNTTPSNVDFKLKYQNSNSNNNNVVNALKVVFDSNGKPTIQNFYYAKPINANALNLIYEADVRGADPELKFVQINGLRAQVTRTYQSGYNTHLVLNGGEHWQYSEMIVSESYTILSSKFSGSRLMLIDASGVQLQFDFVSGKYISMGSADVSYFGSKLKIKELVFNNQMIPELVLDPQSEMLDIPIKLDGKTSYLQIKTIEGMTIQFSGDLTNPRVVLKADNFVYSFLGDTIKVTDANGKMQSVTFSASNVSAKIKALFSRSTLPEVILKSSESQLIARNLTSRFPALEYLKFKMPSASSVFKAGYPALFLSVGMIEAGVNQKTQNTVNAMMMAPYLGLGLYSAALPTVGALFPGMIGYEATKEGALTMGLNETDSEAVGVVGAFVASGWSFNKIYQWFPNASRIGLGNLFKGSVGSSSMILNFASGFTNSLYCAPDSPYYFDNMCFSEEKRFD